MFKEPRVSILLDLWRQALTQEGFRLSYIIMVRHPDEVARSLQKRDGLPYNQGVLLWSPYMLAAELGTRGASRVFVNFDQLLSDPEDVIDKVESGLGVNLARWTWDSTAEIQEFLKSEQKHFSVSGSASKLKKLAPIRKFYDFLQAASLGEPWNVDFTDEMAAWLGDLEQAVGPVLKHLERELRRARADRDAANAREHDLAGITAAARQQLDERDRQDASKLAQGQAEVADLRERAEQLEALIASERAVAADQQANILDRLAVHQAQVEASEAAAQSAASRIEALERELEAAEQAAASRVNALERELEEQAAAISKVATLETALAEAESVAATARTAANEMARREAELQGRMARLTSDVAAYSQERTQLQTELEAQRKLASEAEAKAHIQTAQAGVDAAELNYRLDAALANAGDAHARLQRLEHAVAEANAGKSAIEADLGAAAAREAELQARLAQAAANAEADRAEKAELARALLDAVQTHGQNRGFWRSLLGR